MQNRLEMHLLGGLSILLNGEPLTGFISAKAQALLCYVALTPSHPHLRSTLATLFWGHMTDEDAATNLRQVLANLKKLLEPHFEITRQTVTFQRESAYWLDVEAFEAHGDVTAYAGDLLSGFNVRDAPEFEDWLVVERERLRELAIARMSERARQQMAEGDNTEAINVLRRLLALDPLREAAQRQLIWLLALSEGRAAALAQYEVCRRVLKEQLGVLPERETNHLYERIRDAEHHIHLPPEMTPFVARTPELAELARLLAEPGCRLISLVGMGGIGKTRLGLQAAARAAGRYLHGVAAAFLTPVTTEAGLYETLADLFSLSQGTPNVRASVLNYLRDKHLLLVLDNVEQVVAGAASFAADVLRAAPEVKLLVTSRERLNIQGEWLLTLDGLPLEPEAAGSDSPSTQLFWQTARRARGDMPTSADERAAADHICHLVGGMPLGIELAASWTRLLACSEIADLIQRNISLLESSERDAETRHRSLRAVFEHSWALLSENEQAALRRLALFRGGFRREAAEAVGGASLPLLLGLVDKSLIRRSGERRFDMHEMTREYCAAQLEAMGETAEVLRAHAGYFAHELAVHGASLKGSPQRETIARFSADYDNLRLAWDTAVADADARALEIMLEPLSLYYQIRAWYTEGVDVFTAALTMAEAHHPLLHGRLLAHLAYILLFLGRLDESEQLAQASLARLATLAADTDADLSHATLANTAVRRSRYDDARHHFEIALAQRQARGDQWRIANTYIGLAQVAFRQRDLPGVRQYSEQALELAQTLDDLWMIARAQSGLAIALSEIPEERPRSRELHQRNLDLYAQLNDLHGVSRSYNGLGVIAYFEQDYAQALECFEQSLRLTRMFGDTIDIAGSVNNIGVVAAEMGDLVAARRYLEEALSLMQALGDEDRVAEIEKSLRELETLEGAQS